MRLFELTGYRGLDTYKAATEIKPNTGKKVGSSFEPKSMEDLVNQMKKVGWYRIGRGYYATVFAHQYRRYIVKVFHNDKGYAHYLDYVKSHQSNPHVPKVIGKERQVNKDTSVVRLEKLLPITNGNDPMFRKYINPELPVNFYNIFENPDNLPFLQEHWPQLYKLLQDISGMTGLEDLGIKNVMQRGDTLVITDPLAGDD